MKSKTKKKQKNPRGACGTANNIKKRYAVNVIRTLEHSSWLTVEAVSQEEATQEAYRLAVYVDESKWNVIDREFWARRVVAEGGDSNE